MRPLMVPFATVVVSLVSMLPQATAQGFRPIVKGLAQGETSEEARAAAQKAADNLEGQRKKTEELKAKADEEARSAKEAQVAAEARLKKEEETTAQAKDEASKAAAQKSLKEAQSQLEENTRRFSEAERDVEGYRSQLKHIDENKVVVDMLLAVSQARAVEERVSFGLGIAVLAFGFCLVAIVATVLLRKVPWDNLAFKLFGIAVVVSASLFLVVAGYTEQQIAPIIGLLGTIIGYVLGKEKQ